MTKEEKYEDAYLQIASLVVDESDQIANMANISSLLHEQFSFWWTGFYRVEGDDELVLGPFQGPVACTRIKKGRGVCGTAWETGTTQVVPDVELFPGHIACSSESKSEIVVPLHNKDGEIIGVLDIDSSEWNTFDDTDRQWLEKICDLVFC